MIVKGVASAVLALAMAAVLLIPGPRGAELVGAEFTGEWEESTVDEDRDGAFEELVIVVFVNVFEAGAYGVYGSIDGGIVHGSSGLVNLPAGRGGIQVPFSGADIMTMRPEGSYAVELQLYSSDPRSPVRTLSFDTRSDYDPDRFERGSDYPWTSATVEGGSVVIKNPRVEIRLNATRPVMSFSYPGQEATRASLEVVRLLAFDDADGDGMYGQGDQVRYSSDLARDVDWKMEMDLRSGYRIDLHGIAPLRMVGSPEVTAWASLTIRFDSSSILPPGSSQKFDISIELLQRLDADGLCILQELRDDSGGHTFYYSESGAPTNPERTLSLYDGEGTVNGIYSWNDALLIGPGKADTPAMGKSSYDIGEGKAGIAFTYPLNNDTMFVFHDPIVGIDPDYVPADTSRDDFMTNRPLWMAMGLVFGLTVVLGAVAAARFRRG
jgi:hypothetical protein